jgi:type I restriction enzyme, S subunit
MSAFDEHPLSDFIKRKVVPVDRAAKTLDELNVIAKVTFGGVLHVRTTEEKKGYKGPLFYAQPGDLVISKIRVAQGSLCVVPEELEHLAVSAEYPVYTVDPTKVSADFVRLVIRTAAFKHRVGRLRSGNTTKARIRPSEFEALNIPLPAADQQRALLDAYHAAVKKAEQLEADTALTAQAIQRAFEDALGVAPPPPLPDRPTFIARFKEVERWTHEGILRALTHTPTTSSKWPIVDLSNVGKVSYGLQKSPANRPGKHSRPYLRVANVQRGVLDLAEMKYMDVPDEDMPKLRLMDGDVLLCEGNSPDLVGRGAIWRNQIPDCIHQNHVLRVRVDQGKLLPDFLLAVINSSHGQGYFRAKAKRTTNLASINSTEVAGFPVPLPPLDVQESLLTELHKGEGDARAKAAAAQQLRDNGWAEFERALFDPGT